MTVPHRCPIVHFMLRSRLSAVLVVLVALQLSLAVLPHVHLHDTVRVGEHHLAPDDDACLTAPAEMAPAPGCLVCALHAPAAAAAREAQVLPAPRAASTVDALRGEAIASANLATHQSRGPPVTA